MSTKYPANSRYANAPVLNWRAADGTEIRYIGRRIIPEMSEYSTLDTYRASGHKRIDGLAEDYYGDPELYWRICDANGIERPSEALAEDGTKLTIPLPLEISRGKP